MPVLTIYYKTKVDTFQFEAGNSLLYILDQTAYRIRRGCNGIGFCGLCKVQVLNGKANELSESERLTLTDDQIEQNIRLACQIFPEDGFQIQIIALAENNDWKVILEKSETYHTFKKIINSTKSEPSYGVAIDLGTTNIKVSIIDLRTGIRITGRTGQNPQSAFGADVMTRIQSAVESRKVAREMQELLIDCILHSRLL